jgi:hypothetical protein
MKSILTLRRTEIIFSTPGAKGTSRGAAIRASFSSASLCEASTSSNAASKSESCTWMPPRGREERRGSEREEAEEEEEAEAEEGGGVRVVVPICSHDCPKGSAASPFTASSIWSTEASKGKAEEGEEAAEAVAAAAAAPPPCPLRDVRVSRRARSSAGEVARFTNPSSSAPV